MVPEVPTGDGEVGACPGRLGEPWQASEPRSDLCSVVFAKVCLADGLAAALQETSLETVLIP